MSRYCPMTSSGLRVCPKNSSSISDSHSRNLGQARVQMSHPLSPCVQTSGPFSMSWTGTSFSYPRTWNGTGDDAGGAAGTHAREDHLVVEVPPLGLLGGHGRSLVRPRRGEGESRARSPAVSTFSSPGDPGPRRHGREDAPTVDEPLGALFAITLLAAACGGDDNDAAGGGRRKPERERGLRWRGRPHDRGLRLLADRALGDGRADDHRSTTPATSRTRSRPMTARSIRPISPGETVDVTLTGVTSGGFHCRFHSQMTGTLTVA